MAERPIEQYKGLLRIRKRWAKIGIIAIGMCALVSLFAVVGLVWAKRDAALSGTTALIVIVLGVYPFSGLVTQAVEYRRVNDLLELLDVLEREARVRESEGQKKST